MQFLKEINSAQSSNELQNLLQLNEQSLYDYFAQINQSELLIHKEEFKKIALKVNLIDELDFSNFQIEAFVNLILNASIRLGDMFVFERFYRLLKRKNLSESYLIKASSMFMINVRTIHDLQEKYPAIVSTLEQSFLEEADSNKDATSALINYYGICVDKFGEFATEEVEKIRIKILNSYRESNLNFLKDDVIQAICSVKLDFDSHPYIKIHELLDIFIGRVDVFIGRTKKTDTLIESEGFYQNALKRTKGWFEDIYTVNRELYQPISDKTVFNSLQRGVKVLSSENQLMCYIYAYGKMHYSKLKGAISSLPNITQKHQVIDWGCGQAIGSLAYLEELSSNGTLGNCSAVTLVEASESAIKRGALHLSSKVNSIKTINKGFDELSTSDFTSEPVNVHIFSNILDVELFSLSHLISIVDNVFEGENYFIVSSPFINITRTARIDSFMHYFQDKYNYEEYMSIEQSKGEWIKNWSRVIRVGKFIK